MTLSFKSLMSHGMSALAYSLVVGKVKIQSAAPCFFSTSTIEHGEILSRISNMSREVEQNLEIFLSVVKRSWLCEHFKGIFKTEPFLNKTIIIG